MSEQERLAKRIECICREQNLTYYLLSYKSAVPMTTLMHIMKGSTQNPGVFTISKICGGLGITMKEFFDSGVFLDLEAGEE